MMFIVDRVSLCYTALMLLLAGWLAGSLAHSLTHSHTHSLTHSQNATSLVVQSDTPSDLPMLRCQYRIRVSYNIVMALLICCC